jgi:hypothetical protein
VPLVYKDTVPEGESWFESLLQAPTVEDSDRQEIVEDVGNGEEEVITHALRLRLAHDPEDARLMVCEQTISIPDRMDRWYRPARHIVVQVRALFLSRTRKAYICMYRFLNIPICSGERAV